MFKQQSGVEETREDERRARGRFERGAGPKRQRGTNYEKFVVQLASSAIGAWSIQ